MNKIKILLILSFFSFPSLLTNAQKIFEKNGKFGIQDNLGKTIVRAKYEKIDDFEFEFFGVKITNAVARFKEKNKWGVLNAKGDEILDPIYDKIEEINYLSNSNFLDVQLNSKWGVYDFTGKEIVKPKYDKPIGASHKSTFYTVINVPSVVVYNGFENKVYGLLDSNFKEIIAPKYGYLKYLDEGYFQASFVKDAKKFGIIDAKENVLFDFKYDDVFIISKDIFTIKKYGKWTLLNKKGFSINSNEYEGLAKLRNGRAMVIRNGLYGYIDEKGKEVIPCKYLNGESFFYDGKVKVKLGGQSFEIDVNGNEITTRATIKPRSSLIFEDNTHEKAFNQINFKENAGDSANLKLVGKYFSIANPTRNNKTNIQLIDNVMSEAASNKAAYKVFASYLYNKFTMPKVTCDDALLVHISDKYFCDDEAPYGGAYWLEEATRKRILEYANVARVTLCDKIAPNFSLKLLPQTNFKYEKLHNIKSNYTLLFFWQNDCDYCVKYAKVFSENYSRLKEKGLEIIGISLSNKEIDKCEQLIVQHEMNWINAIDYDRSIFKKFNFENVPKLYLLDKDKRILIKDIDANDVIDYFNK